ncbi:MAG TPA: methyltransferase domain-containing protein [Armatimonadota bacterium]|jgi:ubiquinone/menaquinone biosynthesis C-methylase UbiE
MTSHIKANIDRFSGFADCYDQYRPQPPVVIPEILIQLLGDPLPSLVVDLGSGTGLSTRIWAGKAREIIGIEPNADMRRVAEEQTPPSVSIQYRDGLATETGLADAAADIVCCSQALHWMEPEPTLAEVARVLRPGGIFAAIDCDWPPTLHWQAEQAYQQLMRQVGALEQQHGIYTTVNKWPKNRHLANIQASGRFRYTNELLVHHIEFGNADRLIGLALSQGGVEGLLKIGLTENEIGLTAFRATVKRLLGDEARAWYFSYRVRLGVK